jgi:hypothetical protein
MMLPKLQYTYAILTLFCNWYDIGMQRSGVSAIFSPLAFPSIVQFRIARFLHWLLWYNCMEIMCVYACSDIFYMHAGNI